MRFLCCMGSAAVAAACCVPFFCFPASAVVSTVTLTSAQTVGLFGQTIDCEYLSTDGTYHTTTATYAGSWSISYGNAYSPDGQTFSGRQVVQYAIPYASDMEVTPSDITIFFKTSVDISSLSYIDTAVVQLSDMDFSTQLYGTYSDYWYCSNGYNYALRAGAENTSEYNYYGYISSDNYYKYTVLPCLFSSLSDTTFSTGWAKCGSFKNSTYNSNYYIGFVCPILSEDWQFSGSQGAGSGQSSGGGSDSSGGSGGGTDLSGILTKLDTIIAKLDLIGSNTSGSENSSQNSADQGAVNSNASVFDSRYSEANSYNDNVYQVADLDSVELPDLENSYTDLPSDFSKFWYIDGNPTFLVLMLSLTSSIAILAFIVFGKTF